MREQDYIEWLRGAFRLPHAGNDAALITIGENEVIFTTDMLVEGTHFDGETPARLIGRKAVGASLSDMAAMGGTPLCAVISVCFRRGCGDEFSRDVLSGAGELSEEFGMEIVGGDTTSSEAGSSICVSALGVSPEGGGIGRNGALDGDRILVTGTLGGSMLGRHLEFTPRVREARKILNCARPGSMMDISDGLACDLGHILRESGVGAIVDKDSIPVSDDARKASVNDGRSALDHALNDGEDFELLLTASKEDAERILKLELKCRITSIGRITGDAGCNIAPGGYEHAW